MGKVTYLMNVSADGFVEGPDGRFAWSHPDEEVHRRELQLTLVETRAFRCGAVYLRYRKA